ncbi:MAG: class I SAM-dependent methyltransferase [bacterium]|nr:class I SAM-dependent methyltransferase [bacterium]
MMMVCAEKVQGYMKREIACHLCGGNNFRILCQKDDHNIVRCKDCSLIYLSPQPKIEKEIYEEDFFIKNYKDQYGRDYIEDKENIVRFAKSRFQTIEKYIKPGRILDVGCGLGFYLEVAKERGWEVYGVEISEYASNYAKTELGIPVKTGTLDEVSYPNNFFDAVTFWWVYEHLPNPIKTLKKVRSLLKSGGIIALSLPNASGAFCRFRRKRWLEVHPEDHFVDFTPKTIRRCLKQAGFSVLEIIQGGVHPERIIGKIGGFILIKEVYKRLANYLGLGDTMEVYARHE